MRRSLFTAVVLVLSCNAGLAQVSTMGSTAMGLPSTPGAMVSSPLNGPSPFSATTQPGVPDTTLAPVPLASDPTTPGTVVTCSTPTGQIAPGTPVVPVTSISATGATIGPTPSVSAAPTISASPPAQSGPPAASFITILSGSTLITELAPPAVPPLPPPSIAAPSVPTPTTATTSSTAITAATPLGTIPTPIVGSATGTISAAPPLGSSSTTVCSSTSGGPPTNGASLPLSTPEIPGSPAPGTIQPAVTQLATTSIDPTTTVVPTPNTSACAESMTMNLATPGMMAPANATGATATPGVTPPSGC
jgi:hypothetical protein